MGLSGFLRHCIIINSILSSLYRSMYFKSDACASYVVVDLCIMQICPILMQCRTWNLITAHHHYQTLLFLLLFYCFCGVYCFYWLYYYYGLEGAKIWCLQNAPLCRRLFTTERQRWRHQIFATRCSWLILCTSFSHQGGSTLSTLPPIKVWHICLWEFLLSSLRFLLLPSRCFTYSW